MAGSTLYATNITKMESSTKHFFKIIFFFHITLFILITAVLLYAQTTSEKPTDNYEDMLAFVTENRLQFSWDAVYNVGIISKKNIVISFQPDVPIILINFYYIRTLDPVIKKNDALFVTPRFITVVKDILDKGVPADIQSKISSDETKDEGQEKRSNINPSDLNKNITADVVTDNTFNSIGSIIIDAGHGGKDPGVVGKFTYEGKEYRVLEKNVALSLAKKLKLLLEKEFSDIEIIMTREDDTYVSLEQRTIIANKSLTRIKKNQAVLFISIHGNAGYTAEPSGYETWYLPPEYRRNLIEKSSIKNKQVYSIINSLREEEVTLESIQLAKSVIIGMSNALGNKSKNRGIKEEKWYVVRNAKMPAVLVEAGFITNPEESVQLTTPVYQNTVVKGIFDGIKLYMELFDVSTD